MKKISIKQKITLITFGLFLSVVLLEIGLRIGGLVYLSLQEYRNRISIKQRGSYRILCLGESTTAVGGKYSYPSQLEEILNQRNIGIKFSVINKGIPGTNTKVIGSRLENNLNKYTPNMVMTMMGLGDGVNILPYENIPRQKITLFPKSLRTYKLVKLLSKFKEPIEIKPPESDRASVGLGWQHKLQGKYDKAEELFKGAIEKNPENDWAYVGLGWLYRDQGKYNKAEEMLKKAIGITPENDAAHVCLAFCYKEWGKYKLAEEHFRKANRLRTEYYNPITRHNYQRLKEIVTQRGIRLVCVQYPMRSVEPLKKLFKEKEGIIFVNNEIVFKKAVKQASYAEYFGDRFGGDFGHCTPRGNKLLAENIAGVILKKCFNK